MDYHNYFYPIPCGPARLNLPTDDDDDDYDDYDDYDDDDESDNDEQRTKRIEFAAVDVGCETWDGQQTRQTVHTHFTLHTSQQ